MKNLIFVFSFCFTSICYAETITGQVVGVLDGDTITILDTANIQYKIRLSGIDAPEKKQAFGATSKKNLSDMVFTKSVNVSWHKKDRYGRLIGKVLINDIDVNLKQIESGMAWFYKQYQSEQSFNDRIYYARAENAAKGKKIGLWGEINPIAPWEYRKKY